MPTPRWEMCGYSGMALIRRQEKPVEDLGPNPRPLPTIALIPWGNVLEDFIDPLGVSLETFCTTFTGSWMFGYIEALRRAGTRTVLICVSTAVTTPARFSHSPTGATVCVLPVPFLYRAIRRRMRSPYGNTIQRTFGDLRGVRRLLVPLLTALRAVTPYLATPPWRLTRALRRDNCRALLCQEYEYPRFDVCVLLGRLLRIPVFATFQGGDDQFTRLERATRPLALRACAGLIIGTRTEVRRVRARYPRSPVRLTRIFNPIDVEVWRGHDHDEARTALGIPLDAQIVVWHGRISLWQKGLDLLLDAWTEIRRERTNRDIRLLLVGTGRDAAELHRRIAALRVPDVTWVDEFVHDRTRIRQYLSAADVYAFPSRHEGFPVAPLEAMACGLPVVAADAPGIPDIFEGGEASGGIVIPRNDPMALAAALSLILDDKGWGRELGKRARRRIETSFSLEAVGAQLAAFLVRPSP